MFKICAVVFIFVYNCYGIALPFEGLYKLDIIHYNDFHARYEETSVETPTCRFNNYSCLGGFPRLYHEIMELKKEKPDALLLNAGDSFQGTYWYTLLKWNITQQVMNLLPHDAHAIGNHEFDDGPAGLSPYLSALKAPVVAANMDTSKEPSLQGLYQPYIVVERKGRKIGIIGLITVDTKILSSANNVEFSDPGAATYKYAKILSEQGVDIIILLSHCGLEVDKNLARDYGKYIDIIVGGHSHSLLWNGATSPSGDAIEGPYPIFEETTEDKLHKVLIVQASSFTKYMGNLTIYLNYRGDYVKWEGGPIFLNRDIPEDEEIRLKLAPYAKLVHEAEDVSIGESLKTLHFEDCVFGECALGDVLCDSLVNLAQTTTPEGEYMSFIQRGNIKSSINKGQITQGTVFELLPYNDRIQLFDIQGKYILEALELSVSNAWAYKPFKGPNVLQVSGVHVAYNVSLPEGHRLTAVTVVHGGKTAPFDQEKAYKVVAPTYLADGGDGYMMFKNNKKNVKVIGRDQKAFTDYIKAHSPLDVERDGRIIINE